MNEHGLDDKFVSQQGKGFSFSHYYQTTYGGPPSLQSKCYCDWRNRKLKLTTHLHARQHLNMYKLLTQYSYKCPWQPPLLHSLLYVQNNTASYETLVAARWERTLLKRFYFYNLRLLIWNLHKSVVEFFILIDSGVHGRLHKSRIVKISCLVNLKTRFDVCVSVHNTWKWREIPTWCNNLFIIVNNYMFPASICPSSGVLGCIRFILLHKVFSTRCCDWVSEEPVCSLVHWCKFV